MTKDAVFYSGILELIAWPSTLMPISAGDVGTIQANATVCLLTDSLEGDDEGKPVSPSAVPHFGTRMPSMPITIAIHDDCKPLARRLRLVPARTDWPLPLLDNEVIAVAASLPSGRRIKNGRRKHVLKDVARRLLPGEIIDRPTQKVRSAAGFAAVSGIPSGTRCCRRALCMPTNDSVSVTWI